MPRRLPRASIASYLLEVEWSLAYIGFLVYVFVVITFQLGIASIAIGAGLIGVIIRDGGWKFPPFLVFLTLYLLWAALGYFGSAYPDVVSQAALVLAKLWVVAFVAVNALRTRKQIRLFMVLSVLWFAMYPARGAIFNYVFGGYALAGRAIWNYSYANPNDLAALTLVQLAIAGALVVSEPRGWVKRGAVAAIVVLPILVLMTQSRGAFLALVVTAPLALAGERRPVRALWIAVAVATVAVLVAPRGVWQRVRGLVWVTDTTALERVDPEGSAKSRFEIWRVASRIIQDHPVTGGGFGTYPLAHEAYSGELGTVGLATRMEDTHSTYLNVLAETGYPGLVLFLLLLGMVLYEAETARRKARQTDQRGALQVLYLELGLVAFLIAGVFGSFGKLTYLYVHLALVCTAATSVRSAWAAYQRPLKGQGKRRRERPRQGRIASA